MPRTRRTVVPAVLAVAFVAVSAAGVAAQGQEEGPPQGRYRAAIMNSLQNHQNALRLLLSGEVAQPGDVVLHARAVDDILAMAAGSFPEGSGEGTRALPAVWENWDDFVAKMEAAKAASARLLAAAEAGDMEAAAAANREVAQSCRSCHGDYRARPQRAPGGQAPAN